MLDERIGLYASVDLAFSRRSSLRNSFHRPKAALRLLKTVSVPRGRGQVALDSPIALASKFAAHSYRSATDGSTLIAFRAGK
jgi:hypothetical protein